MRLTESELRSFLEKRGKKASEELSRLGKLDENLRVNLQTEIGREILKEDLDEIDKLWEKLYNSAIGETDKYPIYEIAKFRYLCDRVNRISKRLTALRDGVSKIKEESNK